MRRSGASSSSVRRWLVVALWVLVAPAVTHAQPVDLDALDQYIEQARRAWGVPGVAVAIVDDGEVVLAKGYGVRDERTGEPVDEHTLFGIASNTKAFTAAVLATLVDEGSLSWDDAVRDHLPWFRLYDPYVSADMRIRDLLSHRSGLGTFSGDLMWYGTHYDAEEVVRRAGRLEQASPFRSVFGYQNIMFVAAGLVAETVAGAPWHALVDSAILEPVGMRRSVSEYDSLEARDNVATPHGTWRGELVTFPRLEQDETAAAGGLWSSAAEMARWLLLQIGRGELDGTRVFSEDVSREMWSVHTPIRISPADRERFPSTHFRGYGLGWMVRDYRGRKVVGHGGGIDGMFSAVEMVPEEGFGVVVLTNGMTGLPTAIAYRVVDAFLGASERDWSAELLERHREREERDRARQRAVTTPVVEGTEPSLPLAAYVGTYSGAMYGDVVVSLEDGGGVLAMTPNPRMVADLLHLHYDTFVIEWRHPMPWFDRGRAHFVLDDDGEAVELRLDVPNDDFWFQELELKRAVTEPEG